MIYLELLWSFIQIGLFSIGGGYAAGSLTLPFKPHNTQILYLSLLWAYFFVKFVKIMCASLH